MPTIHPIFSEVFSYLAAKGWFADSPFQEWTMAGRPILVEEEPMTTASGYMMMLAEKETRISELESIAANREPTISELTRRNAVLEDQVKRFSEDCVKKVGEIRALTATVDRQGDDLERADKELGELERKLAVKVNEDAPGNWIAYWQGRERNAHAEGWNAAVKAVVDAANLNRHFSINGLIDFIRSLKK
jgi:hypothetical protein